MFERFVCWKEQDAKRVLRALALEGNEAVFRATHSPISGLVIGGTEAHDVSEATETGLLKTFSSLDRRHAMCVVEGEAGSGKSHLIRWLYVHWPKGGDRVVLIERADGTLDGTLRQLKDKLSDEAGSSLGSIVPQHQLTEQGQKDLLLGHLSTLCRSGTLADIVGDEEWCDKHGVSNILQSPSVRASWKAPERLLAILTLGVSRDSRVARFTARDILELNQSLPGLKGTIVGPGAIRLGHRLREEAQSVRSALESLGAGEEEPNLSVIAPTTAKLIGALNARLNFAVQSAMGISGAALQKMFRDLRRSLFSEKRRLVLLLEDITSAQGVDRELLYALQEKSTTQEQYCDIVSVVGITPSYYREYIEPQANVVQRVTHHVRFGEKSGSFQAVSALQDSSEQVAFASRYLRAIRAGMFEIECAASEGRLVSNVCSSCQHRLACHAGFGDYGGVGLYPLTEKAIGRMFTSLRDPKGTMFLQTPRALIQAVLSPVLDAAKSIETGEFPVSSVETEWHPEQARAVEGLAQELIDMEPEQRRERLRMTVAWWGDGRFPTGGDLPGEWVGVPETVFAAFGLTHPASEGSHTGGDTVMQHGGHPEPPKPPAGSGQAADGGVNISGARIGTVIVNAAPRQIARRRPARGAANVDEQLQRIQSWVRTKTIEDDGFWRERAAEFIKQIPWEDEDIPHWFADEGLGEVRLQGSGQTDQRVVVVPCMPWAAKGLEWSARLSKGGLGREEREVAVRAISVFAQNIRRVVSEWIIARVPVAQDGTPWNFGATVVQVLLVRAWLRGETRPGAPFVEQWLAILSDDSPKGAARRPGASRWNESLELLQADFRLHGRLREITKCDTAIVDVSVAAVAMQSLIAKGLFTSLPEAPPDQPAKTKWLTQLVTSAIEAKAAFAILPAKEVDRLRGRAARILEIAGSEFFSVYVRRAEAAFSRVRQELPHVATGDLTEWFQLLESNQNLMTSGNGSEHDILQSFLATRSLDAIPETASATVLLDSAILAPAESLESIHDLLKQTSGLVNTLANYLTPHEAKSGQVHDADVIVNFGKRITNTAEALQGILL
jgi:hypothetical protein